MIDGDEVSIFLEKTQTYWKSWARKNDPEFDDYHFLDWFCNISEDMQNDFVEYINEL